MFFGLSMMARNWGIVKFTCTTAKASVNACRRWGQVASVRQSPGRVDTRLRRIERHAAAPSLRLVGGARPAISFMICHGWAVTSYMCAVALAPTHSVLAPCCRRGRAGHTIVYGEETLVRAFFTNTLRTSESTENVEKQS